MILIIASACFVPILAYYFIWPYLQGCAEYAHYNNNPKFHSENLLDAVRSEMYELLKAITHFNPVNIFMEFFDVLHILVKCIMVKCLPVCFYTNPFCWLPLFFIAMPAAIKFGHRFRTKGCIRNHNRDNSDHDCIFNGYKTPSKPNKVKETTLGQDLSWACEFFLMFCAGLAVIKYIIYQTPTYHIPRPKTKS